MLLVEEVRMQERLDDMLAVRHMLAVVVVDCKRPGHMLVSAERKALALQLGHTRPINFVGISVKNEKRTTISFWNLIMLYHL